MQKANCLKKTIKKTSKISNYPLQC